MASLLDMLNGGNFGQPKYNSPLTSAVGQAQQVLSQPAPQQQAPARRRGPGLLDTLWGVAAGYAPNATRQMSEDREIARETARLERERVQAQRAGLNAFAGQFSGQPAGPAVGGAPSVSGAPQSAGAGASTFSPQSYVPQLLQLESLGVDTGPLRLALSEAKPDNDVINGVLVNKNDASQIGRRVGGVDLQNVNGFQIDRNDPNNTNRFLPQLGEGQAPILGPSGAVTGIGNIPGSVAAEAARIRSAEDAKNASQASYAGVTAEAQAAGAGRGGAPYAVETVQGPNGPITMSRAELLGAGPIAGVDTATLNAREARNEEDMAIAEASESLAGRVLSVRDQIRTGAFDLSPTAIAGYEIDLTLGRDNPKAAAYGVFRSTVQEFVNDNLRLNKGTQTEGDAQRENQTILRNVNNPQYVLGQMERIQARNEQRSAQARQRVERRSPGTNQGVVSVTSLDQVRNLPSGTRYRAPNGTVYTRN